MTTLMMLLMMQYVISTKAGLVNYVAGEVNVKASQSIAAGASVRTGPNGYAEILLNPGSFLWISSNSEIVLDSVELTTIAVRVVSGGAMIEASGVDKKNPIKVRTQSLTSDIVDDGLYLFSDGTATVLTGKLLTAHSMTVFKKGWRVALAGNGFRAGKISKNTPPTPVESWSRGRSAVIAQANRQTYDSLSSRSTMLSDIWLFSPGLGFWTFMPRNSYRSPYGYRYYSAYDYGTSYSSRSSERDSSSGGSAASSGSTSSGTGSSAGNSGGFGSSGAASERPSNRETVIERKSSVIEGALPERP